MNGRPIFARGFGLKGRAAVGIRGTVGKNYVRGRRGNCERTGLVAGLVSNVPVHAAARLKEFASVIGVDVTVADFAFVEAFDVRIGKQQIRAATAVAITEIRAGRIGGFNGSIDIAALANR